MKKPRTGYQIKKDTTTAELKALVAGNRANVYTIHCSIVKLLEAAKLPGVYWWHTPNSSKSTISYRVKLKAMGVAAGIPDLIISHPDGRFLFLEVKAGKGRLTDEQAAFLDRMAERGHEVATVHSVEQAQIVLAAFGAIRSGERKAA